jgi:hypothetical protein
MMFGRAEGLAVDWEGSQLLITITASVDDSCMAHMLDVGFVHGGIMCCTG